MKFSKLIALTLVAVMLLTVFAACNNQPNDEESSTEPLETTEAVEDVTTAEETTAATTEEEDTTTGEAETVPTVGNEIDLNQPFSITMNLSLDIQQTDYNNYTEETVWIGNGEDDYYIDRIYAQYWETVTPALTFSYVSPTEFSMIFAVDGMDASLICVDDVLYVTMDDGQDVQKMAINVSADSINAVRDMLKAELPTEDAEAITPVVDAMFDLVISISDGKVTDLEIMAVYEAAAPLMEEISAEAMEQLTEEEKAFMDATTVLLEKVAAGATLTDEDLDAYAEAMAAFLAYNEMNVSKETVLSAINLVKKYAAEEPDSEALVEDLVRLVAAMTSDMNGVEIQEEEITKVVDALNTYLAGLAELFKDADVTDFVGVTETTLDNGATAITVTGLNETAMEKFSAILDLTSDMVVAITGDEEDAMPEDAKQEAMDALAMVGADRLSVTITVGETTFALSGAYVLDEETTVNESVAFTWTTENVSVEAPADAAEYTVMSLVDLLESMSGGAQPLPEDEANQRVEDAI